MQNVGHQAHFIYELHVRELMAQWYVLNSKNNPTSVFLASEICRSLLEDKNYAMLEMFLSALPENETYSKNEQIVRAKIYVAYEKKNFQLVYELIKNNTFQNGEDLIKIWDDAHYDEEFERTKKPLTALNRFRIRQRFLPPETICPARQRQKTSLRQSSRQVLQQWLDEHRADPYPSRETKEYLSKKANITPEQVKTWFANARRRLARMQGKENRSLSWQKYQRKKESEECYNETDSSPSLENDETDDECMIIEPKASGDKEDLVIAQHEDYDSMIDMTVNMWDNSEVTSRLPPISSFVSPCNCDGNHTRLTCPFGNETYKPQAMKSLPDVFPLELVQPLVVDNPSLYGPIPLTYYYDYYSYLPVHGPWSSICSPCFYQPNSSFSYEDVHFTMSEKAWPSSTLGLCRPTPCGPPGQLTRCHAASALLDLSLIPRMPGI